MNIWNKLYKSEDRDKNPLMRRLGFRVELPKDDPRRKFGDRWEPLANLRRQRINEYCREHNITRKRFMKLLKVERRITAARHREAVRLWEGRAKWAHRVKRKKRAKSKK